MIQLLIVAPATFQGICVATMACSLRQIRDRETVEGCGVEVLFVRSLSDPAVRRAFSRLDSRDGEVVLAGFRSPDPESSFALSPFVPRISRIYTLDPDWRRARASLRIPEGKLMCPFDEATAQSLRLRMGVGGRRTRNVRDLLADLADGLDIVETQRPPAEVLGKVSQLQALVEAALADGDEEKIREAFYAVLDSAR